MTITVSFATVADSISGLTVPGVNIANIDNIPVTAQMLCPILIPQPNDFITGISPTFETLGSNGDAAINMSYTLNYVFLECETGSGVSAMDAYASLIAHLAAIMKTMLSNDAITGAIDNLPNAISSIGAIQDPSGNQYWGALIQLKILEYVQ